MTPPPPVAEAPVASSVPTAAWHRLAQAAGFALREDAWGLQACLAPLDEARLAEGFVAPLPDLGLLTVHGAESLRFLHSQLTNDVEHLGEVEARWYGYCTAKGRLLASFLGWRDADGAALLGSRTLAEPLRKRLAMFVLRAKARVADASEEVLLFGLGGAAAAEGLRRLGLEAPEPMAVARAGALTLIGLPAVPVAQRRCPRWLLAVPAGQAGEAWHALSAALAPAPSAAWRWTEVLGGVPRIVPATSELFVPQMLNLDLSGGVSFTKGCYPGQEVVARTHYLGKQRRRTFLGRIDGPVPEPGADLPDASGKPAGRVVLAAAAPGGGAALLFEAQFAAIAAGVHSPEGLPIVLGELPYPVPGPDAS